MSEKNFHLNTSKNTDCALKNHYINSTKTAINKDNNTDKKQVYNQQEINWLQSSRRKGA